MQIDKTTEERLVQLEDRWSNTLGLLQDVIVAFREIAPDKVLEMYERYERDIAALRADGASFEMELAAVTRFSWFANAAFPHPDDPGDDPDGDGGRRCPLPPSPKKAA